jgi:hypothetical protein
MRNCQGEYMKRYMLEELIKLLLDLWEKYDYCEDEYIKFSELVNVLEKIRNGDYSDRNY